MKNLRVWQKLVLMGIVFVLPLAVVTYRMTASINTLGTEFAEQELRGLEYTRPLLKLLQDLQQHRGMTSALLSGDTAFEGRVDSKRADVENDIRTIDEVNGRLDGALHVGAKWAALSAACRDLMTARRRDHARAELCAAYAGDRTDDRVDQRRRRCVESHARSRPRQLLLDERPDLSGPRAQRVPGAGAGPRHVDGRHRDRLCQPVRAIEQTVDPRGVSGCKGRCLPGESRERQRGAQADHRGVRECRAASQFATVRRNLARMAAARKMSGSAQEFYASLTRRRRWRLRRERSCRRVTGEHS